VAWLVTYDDAGQRFGHKLAVEIGKGCKAGECRVVHGMSTMTRQTHAVYVVPSPRLTYKLGQSIIAIMIVLAACAIVLAASVITVCIALAFLIAVYVYLVRRRTRQFMLDPPIEYRSVLNPTDVSCCICKDEFAAHHLVQCLPCGHWAFHEHCIRQWFGLSRTCPLCKSDFGNPRARRWDS